MLQVRRLAILAGLGLLVLASSARAQTPTDVDGDGVLNRVDNCRNIPNAGQENQDHDRQGDACDNCTRVPNDNQFNTDGDLEGDACDADDDNDGTDDVADSCPNIVNSGRDTNANAVDDVCERPYGMFQVNDADRITNHNQQAVATDPNGNFVVAWMGYKTGPFGNYGIWARRMAADGSPLAIDFEASRDITPPTVAGEVQARPNVALRANGDFVVVWQSPATAGHAVPVAGQLFDHDGNRVGDQFVANDGVTSWTVEGGGFPPVGPEVGFQPDDKFTLVWGDSQQRGIMARQYSPLAVADTPSPMVLKPGVGEQQRPRAAWDPSGNFTVVWDAAGADGTRDVFAQRFDASGGALGPEKVVSSAAGRVEEAAAITATGAGSFVVVWRSSTTASTDFKVVGRRLTAVDAPVPDTATGPTFEVGAIGGYNYPGVAGNADGSFVVAWRGGATFARSFAADGTPREAARKVNQFSFGDVYTHGVATQPNGGFVVAWQNHMPGYQSMARLFTNTAAGTGVIAQPVDAATGTTPVSLAFDNVTWPGTSSVEVSNAGAPPPAGFVVGDPATWYEITTQAAYTGNVTVCIRYAGVSYSDESALRLWHYEGGAWQDRTTSLDVATDTICGAVSSLSPFAVFEPRPNTAPVAVAGPDLQVECAGASGAAVTLDGSGSHDADGDPLSASWSGPFGSANGLTVTAPFPLGTSTATLAVHDAHASSEDQTQVQVVTRPVGLEAPMAGLAPAGNTPVPPGVAFRQGRTIPLKLTLRCGAQALLAGAPQLVGLTRDGAALNLALLDLDAGQSSDAGSAFRLTGEAWQYNLSTRGLASGSYRVRIQMPDGRSWDAAFVLR